MFHGMGDSSAARGTHRRPARTRAPDLKPPRRTRGAGYVARPRPCTHCAPVAAHAPGATRSPARTRSDPRHRSRLDDSLRPRDSSHYHASSRHRSAAPASARARPTWPGARPPPEERTGPARRPARASLRPGPHGHGHVTKARPRHGTLQKRDSVTRAPDLNPPRRTRGAGHVARPRPRTRCAPVAAHAPGATRSPARTRSDPRLRSRSVGRRLASNPLLETFEA